MYPQKVISKKLFFNQFFVGMAPTPLKSPEEKINK